jgi:hypothetical protein
VTSPPARPVGRRWLGPTVPLLAIALLVLAVDSQLPTVTGLILAAVGLGASVGLRAVPRPAFPEVAPVPALLALAALSVETPIAPLPELLVGAAGVVFVAWLLDDPWRPPAGFWRGALVWAIPAFAVGIAWASTFLLPSSSASIGVAGALLAAALVALAFLVSRPELFSTDEPATI